MQRLSRRLTTATVAVAVLVVGGSLTAVADSADPTASEPSAVLAARGDDSPPVVELLSEDGVSAISRLDAVAPGPAARSVPDDSCTGPDGEGLEVCVTVGGELTPPELEAAERDLAARSAAAPAPGAQARGDVTIAAMQPLPQWCLDQGVANTMWITRTAGCGIYAGTLTVTRTTNGVTSVVGTMNFLTYRYVYTVQSLTTVWANQVQVSPTIITGEASGTQISGTALCGGTACVPVSQTFPVQVPGVNGNANGESYFEWPAVLGSSGTATPSWQITFKAPSAQNPAGYSPTATPVVRCDQALPGSTSVGCVIPGATPELTYPLSGYPEFGAHLLNAETSGLPGSWYTGVPLHRLTNATLRQQNRDTACPGSYNRPTGKTCDEYPFASTWEGAFTGAGGVGGRTFSFCQIPQLPTGVSGPGYSACMIDENENSYAGNQLNSVLYVPFRVIEGDAFYVTIT